MYFSLAPTKYADQIWGATCYVVTSFPAHVRVTWFCFIDLFLVHVSLQMNCELNKVNETKTTKCNEMWKVSTIRPILIIHFSVHVTFHLLRYVSAPVTPFLIAYVAFHLLRYVSGHVAPFLTVHARLSRSISAFLVGADQIRRPNMYCRTNMLSTRTRACTRATILSELAGKNGKRDDIRRKAGSNREAKMIKANHELRRMMTPSWNCSSCGYVVSSFHLPYRSRSRSRDVIFVSLTFS
jgi:hypothetical protein